MYEKLGVDIGCDSQNDFSYADQLSGLLNAMDQKNHLPRTILYYLNPKDAAMLSTMAGNYQGNEEQIRVKFSLEVPGGSAIIKTEWNSKWIRCQIQDSFPPLLECSQTQEVSSLFQDTNISAEFSAIKLETG